MYALIRLQRKELTHVIHRLHASLADPIAVVGTPLDEASRRRVYLWIDRLEAFKREYERRWHMDRNGDFIPDTCLQRCAGGRFSQSLRNHVQYELTEAQKIEEDLEGLDTKIQQDIRLVAYQRVDFLSR